jgi:hypothetical protein
MMGTTIEAIDVRIVYLQAADNSIAPRIGQNPLVLPPSEGVLP